VEESRCLGDTRIDGHIMVTFIDVSAPVGDTPHHFNL